MNSGAGFWARLMAYNIDLIFYLVVAFLLRLIIDIPSTMYVFLGSIIVLFEVGFIASKWSATPGRRYMKIAVLDKNGSRLAFHKALIRTLAKPFSLLIFFGGFAMIAFRKDKRALHDIIASSIVIFKHDQ
ncbi:MAG: RDD family protein [Cyclobacteriaceae bacterium]